MPHATERATTTGDGRRRTGDLDRWPGQLVSKRGLRKLSRSIEGFVQDLADRGEQVTVVGLFQRPEYYQKSRHVYERLATSASVLAGHVMAGFEGEDDSGGDVAIVLLPEGHDLGEQWAVLCVSPRVCVGLVSYDTGRSGVGMSAEASRLFATELSTDSATVCSWLRRFADQAGGLLVPDVRQLVLDAAGLGGSTSDDVERAAVTTLEHTWWEMLHDVDRLQRAERLMNSDPLTGALNRRYLDAYLGGEAGSRAPWVAAVAFDFDDFKQLNDTYGHAVGDEALRVFADTVRGHVRDSDVLVRLGGDEWLLLLPDVSADEADRRVRKILDTVAAVQLSAEGAVVRASAGIGVFPAADVDLEAVDQALYEAKNGEQRIAHV